MIFNTSVTAMSEISNYICYKKNYPEINVRNLNSLLETPGFPCFKPTGMFFSVKLVAWHSSPKKNEDKIA